MRGRDDLTPMLFDNPGLSCSSVILDPPKFPHGCEGYFFGAGVLEGDKRKMHVCMKGPGDSCDGLLSLMCLDSDTLLLPPSPPPPPPPLLPQPPQPPSPEAAGLASDASSDLQAEQPGDPEPESQASTASTFAIVILLAGALLALFCFFYRCLKKPASPYPPNEDFPAEVAPAPTTGTRAASNYVEMADGNENDGKLEGGRALD